MKLKQLSLFLENKPGALSRPVRLLAKAKINILTLSIAEASQFGILRLIVRDWEAAKKLLEKNGLVVRVTDMVAVEVADRPAGWPKILDVLEKAGINVEFMYAFTEKRENKGVLSSASTTRTTPSTSCRRTGSTWSPAWNCFKRPKAEHFRTGQHMEQSNAASATTSLPRSPISSCSPFRPAAPRPEWRCIRIISTASAPCKAARFSRWRISPLPRPAIRTAPWPWRSTPASPS